MKTRLLSVMITASIAIYAFTMTPSIARADDSAAITIPEFDNRMEYALIHQDKVKIYDQPNLEAVPLVTLNYGVNIPIVSKDGEFYKVWLPASMQYGYVHQSEAYGGIIYRDEKEQVHEVKEGDTIASIAKQYNTSQHGLIGMNHLSLEQDIFVGQLLAIPRGNPDPSPGFKNVKNPNGILPPAKSIAKYKPADIRGHWAALSMDDMLNAGIVTGIIENGAVKIKPDQPITRAEFVTIVLRALGSPASADGQPSATFIDVSPKDWFYPNVNRASSLGIVKGLENGSFSPHSYVRRDEMVAMIVRAFNHTIPFGGQPELFEDVPDYWAKPYIDQVSAVGLVSGTSKLTFSPGKSSTRAEAITLIDRVLQKETADPLTEHQVLKQFLFDMSDMWYYINYEDTRSSDPLRMLKYHINTYTSDYFQQDLLYRTGIFDKNQGDGIRMYIEKWSSSDLKVIHTSRQFAALEINNLVMDVRLSGEIMGLSKYSPMPVRMDGMLLMKKTGPGQWKTYSFIPSSKDTPHYIEGIMLQLNKVLQKL